jgi:hypothetical protein
MQRLSSKWVGLVLTAVLSLAGCGEGAEDPMGLAPPSGYVRYLMFMANAEVPIEMVKPVDGTDFHRTIMKRDDAAFEAQRLAAIQYFRERYGVEDVDKNPNFFLRAYQVEPFANYRAYQISGEQVPLTGWEVRDGGWEARVINPAGFTWTGGEFAGQFAPPGTFLLYGDYNIKTDDCGGRKSCDKPREIIMHYRSRCPITIPGPKLPEVVTFKFSCEVFSDEYGKGLGQGISQPQLTAAGTRFQYNAREVITFSEKGGF